MSHFNYVLTGHTRCRRDLLTCFGNTLRIKSEVMFKLLKGAFKMDSNLKKKPGKALFSSEWNSTNNVNVVHLYSATCTASKALFAKRLCGAPSQARLLQCRPGFEHDPFGRPARQKHCIDDPKTCKYSYFKIKVVPGEKRSKYLKRAASIHSGGFFAPAAGTSATSKTLTLPCSVPEKSRDSTTAKYFPVLSKDMLTGRRRSTHWA